MPRRLVRDFPRCLLLIATLPATAVTQERLTATDMLRLESPPATHVFTYGDGELQFGNLRLPAGEGPHPIVIFIHGGCWLSQFNISHTGSVEQGIADAGYAVWSIEYRRVGDEGGGWPGTFEDVANGADFIRTLAPTHNLDLSRVVASGHSAGGYFALWLAARLRMSDDNPFHERTAVRVHGVLALAPAPDLEGLHERGVCGNVIDGLIGGSPEEYPERYRAVSLMKLAPVGVPQTLVIGAHDTSWAPVGRRYYEHALGVGDSLVQVVEALESGHFEMIVPSSSSWAVVRTALDELVGTLSPGSVRR